MPELSLPLNTLLRHRVPRTKEAVGGWGTDNRDKIPSLIVTNSHYVHDLLRIVVAYLT